MKIGWGLLAALVCFLHVAACADSEAHEPGGVVRDSAEIRLIDLPPFADSDPELVLAIDSSWNPAAGLEIGTLSDVAVAPGNRILLLDQMAENVIVLSPSGEVEAVFGRTGQGPGEFGPQGLSTLVATDSSVIIPDLSLQRITEFSFDGQVLAITPFPVSPVYAVDWRRHPAEGLAFRVLTQSGDLILRMVADRVDTLFAFSIFVEHPNLLLPPTALWDLIPEGHLVVGRSDEAEIELRSERAEKPIWRARRTDLGGDFGADDQVYLENLLIEVIRREAPGISPEQLAQNLASVEYPDQVPVLASLMAAPNGDVWVRHSQPVQSMSTNALRVDSSEGFGGPTWDVLTSDGLLRARVRLPEGFTPRRFVGDWIYGILADEMGVETAARVKAVF